MPKKLKKSLARTARANFFMISWEKMGGGVKIPCTMEAPGRGEAPKAWFFRQIGGLYMKVFQGGGKGPFLVVRGGGGSTRPPSLEFPPP